MLFLSAQHCAVLYSVMPYVMAEQRVVCVTAVSMVRVAASVSPHTMPQPCVLCWGKKKLSFFFFCVLFVSVLLYLSLSFLTLFKLKVAGHVSCMNLAEMISSQIHFF